MNLKKSPPSRASLPSGRLLLGDCTERMQTFPDSCIDLVITDPPYLAGYRDRSGRTLMGDRDDEWVTPAFAQIARVLRPGHFCISFYGYDRVDTFMAAWRAAGLRPVGHFVFPKGYASGRGLTGRCHEQAYLLVKGRPRRPERIIPDVLPWRYSGNRLHPTQKPLTAITPLIEAYSKPGERVLDPFCGSGTTGEAARKLGRRFLGIEKDPRYHEVAAKRLAS